MIQMFNVPVSKDGTFQLPEELHELLKERMDIIKTRRRGS